MTIFSEIIQVLRDDPFLSRFFSIYLFLVFFRRNRHWCCRCRRRRRRHLLPLFLHRIIVLRNQTTSFLQFCAEFALFNEIKTCFFGSTECALALAHAHSPAEWWLKTCKSSFEFICNKHAHPPREWQRKTDEADEENAWVKNPSKQFIYN